MNDLKSSFQKIYGREPTDDELKTFNEYLELLKSPDPAECPNCHYTIPIPYKTWTAFSPATKITMLFKLYSCPKCGSHFRKTSKGGK